MHAIFPDGTRLDLDSPRLRRSYVETGVRFDDILPTPPSKVRGPCFDRSARCTTLRGWPDPPLLAVQFFRNGTLPELASVQYEASERDRLNHLEVLLRCRQELVNRDVAEKEKKTGGGGGGFSADDGKDKKPALAADEPDSTMLDNILAGELVTATAATAVAVPRGPDGFGCRYLPCRRGEGLPGKAAAAGHGGEDGGGEREVGGAEGD